MSIKDERKASRGNNKKLAGNLNRKSLKPPMKRCKGVEEPIGNRRCGRRSVDEGQLGVVKDSEGLGRGGLWIGGGLTR